MTTPQQKSLKEISWLVPESEYRADPALSYSTLAKYSREGYNNLKNLFERTESTSLTFGSAVDSIITGGMEEFEERFVVADFNEEVPDAIAKVVHACYNQFSYKYNSLNQIPMQEFIPVTEECKYQLNWKPETRVKVVREKGEALYCSMLLAQGREVISAAMYDDVMKAVDALKTSRATSWFFAKDNPIDNIERLYQLKFKGSHNGINYRCMMDLVVVDHDRKLILPCDLKTSYKPEWDFYKSFVEWRYHIQARLYSRLLKQNLEKDPYFKDFKVLDYKFIVVNKATLKPLVWGFDRTHSMGTIHYGPNDEYKMVDPYDLGEELTHYLNDTPGVPDGIYEDKSNDIMKWLNKQ
jgi:hypothetical protein